MSRIDKRPYPSPQPFKAAGLPPVAEPKAGGPVPLEASTTVPTTAPQAAEEPPKTDGMTDEEIQFLQAGLLPREYSDLKALMQEKGVDAAKEAYQRGKKGPFSPAYGDPNTMLAGARRAQKNPELMRLFQNIKKGDILMQAWDGTISDLIPTATKGPFSHAVVCVSDGPPPDFIEAIGLTGKPDDPSNNRVRRTSLAEQLYNSQTTRVLRPTEGLEAAEAADAINRAVRYTEKQLGKPYDFSFTNNNTGTGLTDAYYCSELAYLAYVSPQGANIKIPLQKSADRDRIMLAAEAITDALKPDDKAALMDKTAKFFASKPTLSLDDMLNYLIDEVLPYCKATKGVFVDADDRDHLKTTLQTLIEGKGFPRFDASYKAFRESEKRPENKWPIVGSLLRTWGRVSMGLSMLGDCLDFCKSGGIKFLPSVVACVKVIAAVMPHAEDLASYTLGANDPRTKTVSGILDRMDWLKAAASHIPLIGKYYPLPARAPAEVKDDFVSPSDLAWADVSHADYNLLPNLPIDPPKA